MRVRLAVWLRALRIRLAIRLVGGIDGVVVSATAWRVALDRLAVFSEWASNVNISKRLQVSHEGIVEDLTRLLVLAAEAGDPSLQLAGLQDRYVAIRYRAISAKKRARLQYEAALRALEARIGKPPAPNRMMSSAPVESPADPLVDPAEDAGA